jgi:hypothetical protein
MLIRNDQVLVSIGMLSLAAAILIKRLVVPFTGEPFWLGFIEGVLIGASIALNIAYLVRLRRERHGG